MVIKIIIIIIYFSSFFFFGSVGCEGIWLSQLKDKKENLQDIFSCPHWKKKELGKSADWYNEASAADQKFIVERIKMPVFYIARMQILAFFNAH